MCVCVGGGMKEKRKTKRSGTEGNVVDLSGKQPGQRDDSAQAHAENSVTAWLLSRL